MSPQRVARFLPANLPIPVMEMPYLEHAGGNTELTATKGGVIYFGCGCQLWRSDRLAQKFQFTYSFESSVTPLM